MWVNLITIIVIAILAFQMYACYFNPSLAYGTFENIDANRQAILTLAGRNFVMIVVTLLALKSQNAMFIAFTFLMNFAREFYDMLLVGYLDHFSLKGIGMMATFLVFLIPYIFALKKLKQLASKED
ncbi:MAG: hypothetical protein EAZ08_08595 [Cytophagales bacterium]|nr:MAG: hypothetical protein EAZ08_08595 [Cytophagales bacterium]